MAGFHGIQAFEVDDNYYYILEGLEVYKNGDDLYVGEFRLHENKFPKTGAHLHYSIYTQDNVSFSDTTMKLLLGLDYSKDSMYNGSWRTVYNPSKLFEIYKD